MQEGNFERLILVVEANQTHAQLIESAFRENAIHHQVVVVPDGIQAMAFLHREGTFAQATRPDLVLLSLNLPEKNGLAVLSEIKADSALRRIPIIILTHSECEADIFKSYELQGNCYVIKSNDLDQLFAIVKRIEAFWLEIVTLPLE
jgi:chemotaxis family two-component system response regulator Rcp1